MAKDHRSAHCTLLTDLTGQCERRRRCGQHGTGTPLAETCCNGRMKVCAISGDRQICAKMAHLGVMPGSEFELICKGSGQQCMIKVNGGTISLDALSAANILVDPL